MPVGQACVLVAVSVHNLLHGTPCVQPLYKRTDISLGSKDDNKKTQSHLMLRLQQLRCTLWWDSFLSATLAVATELMTVTAWNNGTAVTAVGFEEAAVAYRVALKRSLRRCKRNPPV